MNKWIADQLKRCKVAILPYYDNNTTHIFLSKQTQSKEVQFKIGGCYLIEIEDYILNPPSNFSLHSNWNGGIKPTDKIMRAEVIQIMGKMIKVRALGENDNKVWTGWLPNKSVTILEEI